MNSVGIADLSVTDNVLGAAITAMATQVDGSVKSSKKLSSGAKSSDSDNREAREVTYFDCLLSFVSIVDSKEQLLRSPAAITNKSCHLYASIRLGNIIHGMMNFSILVSKGGELCARFLQCILSRQ